MTNKIYEYKDDQDWYVGSYGIFWWRPDVDG